MCRDLKPVLSYKLLESSKTTAKNIEKINIHFVSLHDNF